MAALLTNRSFQVFFTLLAGIGAVSALIASHTLPTSDAGYLFGLIGVGVGVPLTPAEPSAPKPPPPT